MKWFINKPNQVGVPFYIALTSFLATWAFKVGWAYLFYGVALWIGVRPELALPAAMLFGALNDAKISFA